MAGAHRLGRGPPQKRENRPAGDLAALENTDGNTQRNSPIRPRAQPARRPSRPSAKLLRNVATLLDPHGRRQ
jgi:hypothetical protein